MEELEASIAAQYRGSGRVKVTVGNLYCPEGGGSKCDSTALVSVTVILLLHVTVGLHLD